MTAYKVLAYYSVNPLSNPHEEVLRHKEFFKRRDFKGRIYISEQGINGQASGLADDADAYMAWLQQNPSFKNISFKIHPSKEHVFPKMTVKYRKQLVAIDCEIDFNHVGERVSPQQWKQMLEAKGNDTILLDVRNDYEWKVGHFEGAELPPFEAFRQFPEYVKSLKEKHGEKKVMMYCTGGIRCEFFSAVMKKEGFKDVYQLDGGIINYCNQEKFSHFRGKLFVFDDRLSMSVGNSEPISECTFCKGANDVYYNCANVDCNALYLCCLNCLRQHKGCCSEKCIGAPRVRPYTESAKPFRKLRKQEEAPT